MIAINILIPLLLISFSLCILLLEKQKSYMCAFSAAPASGPALEEQCHPQVCPKHPRCWNPNPASMLCYVCPALARSSLPWHQLQDGATLVEAAGKTRRGLMKISKMQLKSSPSIRNFYSCSCNTARKTFQDENCWESCDEVVPGGCQGPGAGSRWVGKGREMSVALDTGRQSVSCLLYLLFISLMRLFPGSLITIIETIPFLTLFTAWKRKSL